MADMLKEILEAEGEEKRRSVKSLGKSLIFVCLDFLKILTGFFGEIFNWKRKFSHHCDSPKNTVL